MEKENQTFDCCHDITLWCITMLLFVPLGRE